MAWSSQGWTNPIVWGIRKAFMEEVLLHNRITKTKENKPGGVPASCRSPRCVHSSPLSAGRCLLLLSTGDIYPWRHGRRNGELGSSHHFGRISMIGTRIP
ncbi:Camp-Dependent Protein Kinase Catalytic Subunit Prkx [Manis pentadactyla]|nr:Camp-Dependent Protein Kinase Catalytic Subunit Prkx [Manis pentadactyla]